MITERMTQKEIKEEVLADYPNISAYACNFIPKFRRLVIKINKFPVIVDKLYTSKRHNKWIIILHANSKKDIGNLTRGIYISYYNTNHGYYAVAPYAQGITIYTPHYFSRYAQRKDVDLHGIDLIVHHFRNNTHVVCCTEEIEMPDGSRQKIIEGSSREGILLGLMLPHNIILARTFITREMAKGDQVEYFNEYENWRKKIFDNPLK